MALDDLYENQRLTRFGLLSFHLTGRGHHSGHSPGSGRGSCDGLRRDRGGEKIESPLKLRAFLYRFTYPSASLDWDVSAGASVSLVRLR